MLLFSLGGICVGCWVLRISSFEVGFRDSEAKLMAFVSWPILI